MEIDDAYALKYFTYFMMNWQELRQEPSVTKCVSCGEGMLNVEQVRDKKGLVFEGLVCHRCKTVLWARKSL